MRKEIIVAIIVGLFLGLVVAYGIRTARLSLENRQTSSQQTATSTAPTDSTKPSHSIFITSPEPNSVTEQGSTTVIGTTSPDSLISVISDFDQVATIADSSGNFTATLELNEGVNSIEVKSYNTNGESTSTSLMIVYSPAEVNATSSANKP